MLERVRCSAATSTSPRKTSMFTILSSGPERSCAARRSAKPWNKSASGVGSMFSGNIIRRAATFRGGTIARADFAAITACASTISGRPSRWPKSARMPGSTRSRGRSKNRRTMLRWWLNSRVEAVLLISPLWRKEKRRISTGLTGFDRINRIIFWFIQQSPDCFQPKK